MASSDEEIARDIVVAYLSQDGRTPQITRDAADIGEWLGDLYAAVCAAVTKSCKTNGA